MTSTEIRKLNFLQLHPAKTPAPTSSCTSELPAADSIHNRRLKEITEHFDFVLTTRRLDLLFSNLQLTSYLSIGHPKLPC